MALETSYQQTIDYLYALQKHGIKLALSNSLRLMELMGNPHLRFRAVHVAGTNGKGSTAAFIASMLRAAGFRVGLYTSPHLVSFTERIRIDNVPITEQKTVELAKRVREAYEQDSSTVAARLNPTFFEVTTAMAFTHFAEEGVDIAVIEVGMGGRLDATNIITPLVSVITNIDREHTEFLGETLEQIAGEKAGIIKPGVPVVSGAVQPEVVALFERQAASVGAPLSLLNRDFLSASVVRQGGYVFDYQGIEALLSKLTIALSGRYQVNNACLALAVVERLGKAGFVVPEDALRRGLAGTRWAGRLERVAQKPDVYLDGAHNPASAKSLAAAIGDLRQSYRRLTLVLGILGDKDYRGILAELLPLADHVVVTRPQYARALEVGALAEEVRSRHGSVLETGNLEAALSQARKISAPDDLILVTGSLYVVGDARALFFPPSEQNALAGLRG